MDRQNLKHEVTISDNTPKNNGKKVEGSGIIEFSRESRQSITKALSNFLVLQTIFAHLDGEDLERCTEVNQFWNSVIGEIYARNFKVALNTRNGNSEVTDQNHVTIKEKPWSSKPTEKQNYCFADALKFIMEKSSQFKIAINLVIKIEKFYRNKPANDFLSNIGVFVHTFSPYFDTQIWYPVSGHLERCFPNLHHLDLSRECFWECLSQSDLKGIRLERGIKSLKKITFPDSWDRVKRVEPIFKLAPNLKEIHNFPLAQVDVLISTGKAHLVKSIIYPDVEDEDLNGDGSIKEGSSIEIAFKKFALLEPKLTSFGFSVERSGEGGDFLYRETLQPSVRKIFQSSRDSLETLEIFPMENFDFRDIPPLTSLKTMVIKQCGDFYNVKLFPLDIDLQRIFPNVSVVHFRNNGIACHFTPSVLLPWGSQIKELSMGPDDDVTADLIEFLGDCFPSVKNFRFSIFWVIPDPLQSILPAIAASWPQMEFLTIDIPASVQFEGCSFDSVFTGISDQILSHLRHPFLREKFTEAEIDGFRNNSTIRKLSKLKILKLDYSESYDKENFVEALSTITSLSKEFGFEFLPPTFKIIVRDCWEYFRSEKILSQGLKTKLSGVAAFDFQLRK